MKIIAFTNKKGGVGKTTSSVCTAAYLGVLGKKVLLIDMDPQSNATQASNGDKNVQGTFDFMKGAPLEDVLQHSLRYDFIGADKRLSKASTEFDDVGREHILENVLKKTAGYHYCIIDTPPSMEILTLNALTAADEVIICCQSDGFSISGLADMKKNIDGVKRWYNSKLKIGGILMTRHNPRTMIAKQLAEIFSEAAKTMDAKVFTNYIRENTAIRESQVMQQDIYTYRPTSHGAEDYASFVQEYLGDEI